MNTIRDKTLLASHKPITYNKTSRPYRYNIRPYRCYDIYSGSLYPTHSLRKLLTLPLTIMTEMMGAWDEQKYILPHNIFLINIL